MELLSSARPSDLLLAVIGGLFLSSGAVALGPALPAGGAASALGWRAMALPAALALALVVLAGLLIAFVLSVGHWAPSVIAAGLGLLAGPPLSQLVFGGQSTGTRPAYAALFAACAAAGVLASRLAS